MTAQKWIKSGRGTNPVDVLTTELNSLGSTGTALSSVISNNSDRDTIADFYLICTYGSAPTANSIIELYLVRSYDGGTTFEDASTTGPIVPAGGHVGGFQLRNVTTQQIMCQASVLIPPGDFKVMVRAMTTGQTMAASGNILKADFYNLQNV